MSSSAVTPASVEAISPLRRLLGYLASEPYRYAVGIALTLGYAISFQLIPLSVREVVGALERAVGSAPETAAAAVRTPALLLVAASLIYAGFRLSSRIVMFRIGRRIEYALRNEYFDHLQRQPQSFFQANRTGDLMSRAVNDINSVRLFLGMGLLNVVQTPVLFLGALVVMLRIDAPLTFWALLPFPLFVVFARIFGRMMFRANLAAQEQLGRVSNQVQENAAGVQVVRSYALEAREIERFEAENQMLYRRMLRAGFVHSGMFASVAILPALSSGLVLWMGGQAVQAGRLASQDLWVFWIYIGMLTFPTVMLGFVISIAQRGLAAFKRLGEILDTVPTIRDRADLVAVSRLKGAVRVEGLSFTYPGATEPALRDLEFTVGAGQTIGIVGTVGSGKSTLVEVVPRLLEIDDGAMFIDEVDLNRLPLQLLRKSIAMVPQDSFLFSISVADNIRYGAPDATMEEVRRAASQAQVLDDIEAFPQGFETVVGERGVTLSGGQRQRICLARALMLKPSLLVLDDALSSVDHATEEAILRGLERAREQRTCFIVGHRISTVRDADQILVLDRGRITEKGTHDELVSLGGFYARLYRRQQLADELGLDDSATREDVA